MPIFADRVPGTALEQAAKRKRIHTYPELAGAHRCKLVVLALEVGGRRAWPSYGSWQRLVRAKPPRGYARPCGCTVGRACWLWRRNAWLTRYLSCPWRQRTNATARNHLSATCSRMLVTPSQCPRAVFRLRASPPVPRRSPSDSRDRRRRRRSRSRHTTLRRCTSEPPRRGALPRSSEVVVASECEAKLGGSDIGRTLRPIDPAVLAGPRVRRGEASPAVAVAVPRRARSKLRALPRPKRSLRSYRDLCREGCCKQTCSGQRRG